MAIEFLQQISLNETPVKLFVPEKLTTTQRDAISSPAAGRIIFNTSVSKFQGYIGSGGITWQDIGGNYSVSTSSATVSNSTASDIILTGPSPSDTDSVRIVTPDADGLSITNTTDTITIKHQDTSSVSDLTATSRTYVTALTFDTFGHVTDYDTASESVVQTSVQLESGGTARTGAIVLADGTNVDIVESPNGTFTINSSFTNTTYDLSVPNSTTNIRLAGTDSTLDDVTISGTADEINVTRISSTELRISQPNDVTIGNDLAVGNDLSVSGNASIQGSLTITGDLISTQAERIDLEDSVIQLNSNASGTPANTADAGLEVNRGSATNVKLLWDEGTDRFTFTNDGSTFHNIPISTEYNNYVHHTQTAISIDEGGKKFLSKITVNTEGHVTEVEESLIQSAATTQKGIVELATNAEATTGTDTARAVTPAALHAAVGSLVDARSSAHTITGNNSLTEFTISYGFTAAAANDVMIQVVESSSGETVFAEVDRESNTQCKIKFANAPASSKEYRVLCFKIA